MKSGLAFAVLVFCQLSTFVAAQESLPATALQGPTVNSFAVVLASKVLTVEGDWKQSTHLREYANAHTGTYIVFETATGLSLFRKPEDISKVLNLYKEVARLGKEQELLEAKQAPLAKRQEELGNDMSKAGSPEEMRRIGAEQSKIGFQQGGARTRARENRARTGNGRPKLLRQRHLVRQSLCSRP